MAAETEAGVGWGPFSSVLFRRRDLAAAEHTVAYQNRTPGFADDVPYVLALVELEEGVRMFTNIVECDPRQVSIGMAVEVTFTPATDQISVPFFKPAEILRGSWGGSGKSKMIRQLHIP